jgi:hypothetical protein
MHPRTKFRGVECDHANRVAVLAGHQVGDGGFEIGLADIGLGECRAKRPVIVDDDIKVWSGPFGTIEGSSSDA